MACKIEDFGFETEGIIIDLSKLIKNKLQIFFWNCTEKLIINVQNIGNITEIGFSWWRNCFLDLVLYVSNKWRRDDWVHWILWERQVVSSWRIEKGKVMMQVIRVILFAYFWFFFRFFMSFEIGLFGNLLILSIRDLFFFLFGILLRFFIVSKIDLLW